MNQQEKPQGDEPIPDSKASAVCPPFVPQRLMRQLSIDDGARWVAVVTLLICVITAAALERLGGGQLWLLALVLIAASSWVTINMISARAAQHLPRISALLEYDQVAAEATLAQTLRGWPIQRSVRLLLYHRLAALRHRQQRFAESAAISQTLLSLRMGKAAQVRPHLLLILAESCLACGDVMGTYLALVDLHRARLSLIEALQLLAIQTRYEIAAGYDQAALYRVDQKIPLVELMPMPQCGAIHAMLAVAAHRCQQPELAEWLRRRAELLCAADELEAYFSDRPAMLQMV